MVQTRWAALALLCGLQFMLVLDITVVNVALPRIQADLGFSLSGLAWVVNGYVLMSGGLLLLGGRLADAFGRRKLLLIGVAVFAAASALSGVAWSQGALVAGRLGQGLAEALAAPASLGLVALLFTDPRERAKALGVWGGLAALGGTLGYVLSGVLTDLASWRWIFFINLPVAAAVLFLLPRWVPQDRDRKPARLGVPGALGSTLGLVALVYGLLQAADHPWLSLSVGLPVVAGLALVALTLVGEARAGISPVGRSSPGYRTRTVVNLNTLLFTSGFFAYTFLTTLFEQQVLGYSPLVSGLSWLPLGVSIGVGIGLGSGLMTKVGVKAVAVAGFFGAAVGLGLTSLATLGASYLGLLPGMVVFGVFAGMTMPSCTSAALHGVDATNAGRASGVQTTMQQVGAALGLAVLVPLAAVAGNPVALRVGAGMLVVGGLVLLFLLERVNPAVRNPVAEALGAGTVGPGSLEAGSPNRR